MHATDEKSVKDQNSTCPALTLPPELWISILRYFSRSNTSSARRQLYYISLVSTSFQSMVLPLLYSQLTLSAYVPLAAHSHNRFLQGPMVTVPAVSALRTLASRPDLHGAVKSVQFLGHIDTVVLSRRTSARTSDILEARDIRDLFVATLPFLTSLSSISFTAVALTFELCTALLYLPGLEQLILRDCRAPTSTSTILREGPGEIRLKHVELIFGAWTDTSAEVEVSSTFVYSPKLTTLVTDQPRVLTSLLAHKFTIKLSRLELRDFRERDALLMTKFLSHDSCTALKALVLDGCDFSRRFQSTGISFPRLPELQLYSGPREMAHLFITGASVQHLKLRVSSLREDFGGISDLNRLTSLGRILLSLEVQLYHEELYLTDSTWAALGDLFPMLWKLRIEHDVPPELFQTHVFPKCLAMLPKMTHLKILALVAPGPPSDPRWQNVAIRDLVDCQPTLQEISLSMDETWICLAGGEWNRSKADDF